MIFTRRVSVVATLLLAGVACSDGPAGPEEGALLSVILSNPVPHDPGEGSALVEPETAYISLPPGAIPGAQQATVRNQRTSMAAEVPMTAGGFDPVAIGAVEGDSILVEVTVAGGALIRAAIPVPSRKRPVVVRTDPPPRKRDVPLNASVIAVLSEPVDPVSVGAGAFQLYRNGIPVAGVAQVNPANPLIVEFLPSDLLEPSSDYELVVSESVRDLDNELLLQAVRVPFRTGLTTAAVVASIRLDPATVELRTGDSRQVVATPLDIRGRAVAGRKVTWQTLSPSVATVSGAGLVTAVSAGTAVIVARADGRIASAEARVVPRAASVQLPAATVLDLPTDTVRLSAVVRDQEGVVLPTWPVTWSSSNAQVAQVTSDGVVSPVGIGSATITARSENAEGQGQVNVVRLPVQALAISPSAAVVPAQGVLLLSAVVTGPAGKVLKGRATTWSSSHPVIATVSAEGLVRGISAGETVVTATTEGFTAVRTVTVVGASPSLALGAGHSCTISSGTVFCWGDNSSFQLAVASAPQCNYLQSAGTSQMPSYSGSAPCITTPGPVTLGAPAFAVATGVTHSCALTTAGTAWCWGSNIYGELGSPGPGPRAAPGPVAGGRTYISLTAGYHFSCGLRGDGVAECWGQNLDGQLGNGSNAANPVPGPVAGGNTFVALSAGFAHVCGIASSGRVLCWGRNTKFQGGHGTASVKFSPTPVSGDFEAASVASGWDHTCAVTSQGQAYCWGEGAEGRLGTGDATLRMSPTLVSGGHTWLRVATGYANTCGITSDGEVMCWGDNWAGQVGNGTFAGVSLVPTRVSLAQAVSIAVGGSHACAVTVGFGTWCWGYGALGQNGDGLRGFFNPIPVRALVP